MQQLLALRVLEERRGRGSGRRHIAIGLSLESDLEAAFFGLKMLALDMNLARNCVLQCHLDLLLFFDNPPQLP